MLIRAPAGAAWLGTIARSRGIRADFVTCLLPMAQQATIISARHTLDHRCADPQREAKFVHGLDVVLDVPALPLAASDQT